MCLLNAEKKDVMGMLSVDEIRLFIENDAASVRKKAAKIGQRYYEAEHDIRDYRIFYYDADGNLKEDKYKSNIKISHPFFTELVDQEAQYIISGGNAFIRSDDPELQKELNEYFNDNEDFLSELYEIITGCVVKGFEYAYAFKDAKGKVRFQCADSIGVVEVRESATDDGCDYIIYWYLDRIDKDSKYIKRIQVWDKEQTWFFCQVDDGDILPDDSQGINPRPHTLYTNGKDGKIYFEGFGFIPFFRLDNNRKQVSGLKAIKALIDDYDLLNCGLSNNIQDTSEALYVVKGFQGDNLDELMTNIRSKKHIGVDDEGGVEIQTVSIPVDARKVKLEMDETNIYRFGMGLNTHGLRDNVTTTNMAIKAAYSLLDLKTNRLEIRLKQFLRKLLDVVLREINKENGTDYTQHDVYFVFDRIIPTNILENADIELKKAQKRQTEINTILNLATVIDDETKLQLIAEQLDIDYNELKEKVPDVTEDLFARLDGADA